MPTQLEPRPPSFHVHLPLSTSITTVGTVSISSMVLFGTELPDFNSPPVDSDAPSRHSLPAPSASSSTPKSPSSSSSSWIVDPLTRASRLPNSVALGPPIPLCIAACWHRIIPHADVCSYRSRNTRPKSISHAIDPRVVTIGRHSSLQEFRLCLSSRKRNGFKAVACTCSFRSIPAFFCSSAAPPTFHLRLFDQISNESGKRAPRI